MPFTANNFGKYTSSSIDEPIANLRETNLSLLIDVVKLLLSANADPTICTTNEWGYGKITLKSKKSPLMVASIYGYIDVVKTLLKWEPGINLKDSEGDTALSLAKKFGKDEIVKILEDAQN